MGALRRIAILIAALGLFVVGNPFVLRPAPVKTWRAPRHDARPDPDLGTQITAAYVADGKLWLMGGASLVSFSLSDGTRSRFFRGSVGAVAKAAGHLWVLRNEANTYRLLEWKDGRFTPGPSFATATDETPLAMTAVGADPAVVSTRAVRVRENGGMREIRLASNPNGRWPFGLATAGAPMAGGAIYVGFNRGEWGGDLKRIDLATGAVDPIEDTRKIVFNGTLLDKVMDEVTAIIPDPRQKDCVIVAAGAIHYFVSGRILRVCGTKASLVFQPTRRTAPYGKPIVSDEAFFGPAPAPDGYWAAGTGCAYRFRGASPPEQFDCPELEDWHGLHLTRALPGVILLATNANQRFSLSGYTPLIASLDDGTTH